MKILHIRNSPFFGGPERLIVDQMRFLKNEVSSELALLPDGELDSTPFMGQGPIEIKFLGGERSGLIRSIRDLVRLLKTEEYDLICTHDYKSNFVGKIATFFSPVRQISVFHGKTSHSFKARVYEMIDRLLLGTLPAIVAVSETTRTGLPQLMDRTRVIHNAIDLSNKEKGISRDVRKELGIQKSDLLFMSAGRLSKEKGQAVLIKAFASVFSSFPNARLIIAGDGEERHTLEALVNKYSLQNRVHFLGFVTELGEYLSEIDVFVLPSIREGLPMVLLETAGEAKPVVATRVGGIPELIENGRSGSLVSPGNSDELAEAMMDLARHPDKRSSFGLELKKRVEKSYSMKNHANKYLGLYKDVLQQDTIWISWEKHRRSRGLSNSLGIRLYEILSKQGRLFKYPGLLYRTFGLISSVRPKTLVVQSPSIILGFFAAFFKNRYGYRLVVDAHNESVQPFNYNSYIYKEVLKYIHRQANYLIVTNSNLKGVIEKNGGKALVLLDKIPDFSVNSQNDQTSTIKKVVFICTYAPDEPYKEVIEATKKLPSDVKIFITGNYKSVEPAVIESAPANVCFTGFMPDHEYLNLLGTADAIVDLTEMEDCLVCGAYEAVALEKPLVTSDTQALRTTFPRGTLYSNHNPDSLAKSIQEALQSKAQLSQEMKSLKISMDRKWRDDLASVRSILEGSVN